MCRCDAVWLLSCLVDGQIDGLFVIGITGTCIEWHSMEDRGAKMEIYTAHTSVSVAHAGVININSNRKCLVRGAADAGTPWDSV